MTNHAPLPLLVAEASPSPTHPTHPTDPSARGWPVLRLGFRPFYLGAAAFAVLAIPVWVAGLLGLVTLRPAVPPLLWHAHDMLFGFAVAVVIGFLLTAGKAWTGLPTPRGGALAALALLWLAARLAALAGPPLVYALLDLLLLPCVAVVLLRVLLRAGNRRNLPLAGILLLLALANLGFHGAALGLLDIDPVRPLHAALALLVMIECVIAGRVIPAFSMGAIAGLRLQAWPWLERLSLASTALALAGWVLWTPHPVTAAAFMLAAALQALRWWRWQPWRSRSRPMLWVLHAAYAWLPIGFGLLAWAQLGGVAASAGIHALAVGATGGLIIGMVTRTARGHTGRPLQAGTAEVSAYALLAGAALARVLLPLLAPQHTLAWLVLAALAWAAAFGLYLVRFTPWLVSARLDGKDG